MDNLHRFNLLIFAFVIITFQLIKCPVFADEIPDDKVVYLTFDDGPTIITNKLLDVLKENNVKATFFVVGKEIEGREEILKRIYNEGHSIGLHTYSHNFRKIYRSNSSFIDEMDCVAEKVKEVTGYSAHAIRYPGGSCKHLNEEMLNELHDCGYRVFDWNVNLCDGIDSKLSPKELIENSKKCKGSCYRRIILMHCNSNNRNTIKALPELIQYYKKNGYIFLPITDKTPEYYYKLKNN